MNPEISAAFNEQRANRLHRNMRKGQSLEAAMQNIAKAFHKRHRKAEKRLRIAEKGGIAQRHDCG